MSPIAWQFKKAATRNGESWVETERFLQVQPVTYSWFYYKTILRGVSLWSVDVKRSTDGTDALAWVPKRQKSHSRWSLQLELQFFAGCWRLAGVLDYRIFRDWLWCFKHFQAFPGVRTLPVLRSDLAHLSEVSSSRKKWLDGWMQWWKAVVSGRFQKKTSRASNWVHSWAHQLQPILSLVWSGFGKMRPTN